MLSSLFTLACLVQPTLLCYLCNSFSINYCENGVCTVYYLQNIGENEDLLSYPKVLIKKGNIYGKSLLFPLGISQGIQWARRVSQGPEELSLNTWITFLKLNSNLVKYKSLSLHEVNKPSTESLWIRYRWLTCATRSFLNEAAYYLLYADLGILRAKRRVIKLTRSPCYIVQSCEKDLNTFLCFYSVKQDNGYEINEASNLHAANVLKARSFVLAC